LREIHYSITAQEAGLAIEPFLKKQHGYSTRTITKLKHYPEGIRLNGVHARTIDIMQEGDDLCITFLDGDSNLDNYIRSDIPVEICYEDADVMVYNKPPFMPCHQSIGHGADTLANVFATHCDRLGQKLMYRPLNRLDRDTTGAVLIGKTRFSAAAIGGNFHKIYRAIVCGVPEPREGRIDLPIRREKEEEMRRIVAEDGQQSITNYKVIADNGEYSLVDFMLETGRTHQIRVHMSHIGYPLIGDPMYGIVSEKIDRQALHCTKVSFEHPVSKEWVEVHCPLPEDMKKLCEEFDLQLPERD